MTSLSGKIQCTLLVLPTVQLVLLLVVPTVQLVLLLVVPTVQLVLLLVVPIAQLVLLLVVLTVQLVLLLVVPTVQLVLLLVVPTAQLVLLPVVPTVQLVLNLEFNFTRIKTVCYGHIAPTRAAGKVTCMFYATVGVPLTGILLARTSDVFGEKVYAIYKSKLSGQKQRSRIFIVTATVLYLLLGFVVFLFLPAIVFVFIEGWSYLDSIYYAFITLTTIGFGDLVSGQNMDPGTGHIFYQLFVIVWIISSLGYWVMVANFITRALRSKKLHASLMHRAKLLKEIMDKQSDPVFLPQRSKYTMNFMMQLSSMLAVDPEAAQELQLSDADEAPSLRETKARSASMPMGIPGIASLFNLPQSSPSGINTQICKSLRRLDGGKWFTGSTEKPHKRKGLTSPGRMCLMGGGLACATLLLAGAQVPSQPSSKRSSLFRLDSPFCGKRTSRTSLARAVFGRSSSPHASLGHVYEVCPQDSVRLSEQNIYELLASHPDDVIVLSTPDDTIISEPNYGSTDQV
ncbi:Potassium channel domain [Trinorchestia longiramus]|nr:Potassium channel domain [Trinorchestia longiramus]